MIWKLFENFLKFTTTVHEFHSSCAFASHGRQCRPHFHEDQKLRALKCTIFRNIAPSRHSFLARDKPWCWHPTETSRHKNCVFQRAQFRATRSSQHKTSGATRHKKLFEIVCTIFGPREYRHETSGNWTTHVMAPDPPFKTMTRE